MTGPQPSSIYICPPVGLFNDLEPKETHFDWRRGGKTTGAAARGSRPRALQGLPMTIRGGGDPPYPHGLRTAMKNGPAAPELRRDAPDCIVVAILTDQPNTRLRGTPRQIVRCRNRAPRALFSTRAYAATTPILSSVDEV